jgi:hypothetical protein
MYGQDVGMVQAAHGPGFLQKALLPLGVASGVFDYLDGYLALQAVIPRAENLTHAPGAQRR